jgi:hypothetical protein
MMLERRPSADRQREGNDARGETTNVLMKLATDNGDANAKIFLLVCIVYTQPLHIVFAEEYSLREKATPGGSVTSVLKRKHAGTRKNAGGSDRRSVCDNLACYKGCF